MHRDGSVVGFIATPEQRNPPAPSVIGAFRHETEIANSDAKQNSNESHKYQPRRHGGSKPYVVPKNNAGRKLIASAQHRHDNDDEREPHRSGGNRVPGPHQSSLRSHRVRLSTCGPLTGSASSDQLTVRGYPPVPRRLFTHQRRELGVCAGACAVAARRWSLIAFFTWGAVGAGNGFVRGDNQRDPMSTGPASPGERRAFPRGKH